MERKPFENVKEVLEQRKESPSCTLDAVIYSCRQKLTRGSAGDMRGRARGLSDLSLLTCVVCFRSESCGGRRCQRDYHRQPGKHMAGNCAGDSAQPGGSAGGSSHCRGLGHAGRRGDDVDAQLPTLERLEDGGEKAICHARVRHGRDVPSRFSTWFVSTSCISRSCISRSCLSPSRESRPVIRASERET